jgi:hypothetical protein
VDAVSRVRVTTGGGGGVDDVRCFLVVKDNVWCGLRNGTIVILEKKVCVIMWSVYLPCVCVFVW